MTTAPGPARRPTPRTLIATGSRQPAAGGTIDDARAAVNATGVTLEEEPGKTVHQYQRAIAVYGLITVRTDGERVLVAQKLESPSGARQFDYHCLEPVDGELVYNPDR